MKKNGLYRWLAASRAFLDRSRESLAQFDEKDDVQQLFVAALMLRYGIEARLFEYIEAELPQETRRDGIRRISDVAATKLLARLTGLNPRVAHETMHVFHPEQEGGHSFGFKYTPVTRSLAVIHGRLGGLLHFNYFKKNPEWYVATRTGGAGAPTLLHARDLIAEGIDELTKATAGTLLNNPTFARKVGTILAEVDEQSTQPSLDESSNER
jgi:hypothetical protein